MKCIKLFLIGEMENVKVNVFAETGTLSYIPLGEISTIGTKLDADVSSSKSIHVQIVPQQSTNRAVFHAISEDADE